MPKTCLQLRFRLRGPNLDPERLTATFEIDPARSFHVGELTGRAVHDVAGWDWFSDWSGRDTDPLIEHFLQLFGPHEAILHSCVDEGATVALSVVGDLDADVVDNQDEAERLGFGYEDDETFTPFLDCDRVGVSFDTRALQFLASISASLHTHIDIDLDDGNEGCGPAIPTMQGFRSSGRESS
jgi:hypothetical protein